MTLSFAQFLGASSDYLEHFFHLALLLGRDIEIHIQGQVPLNHSRRSAVIGSTANALSAGTRQAIAATASSRNELLTAISG